MGDYGSLDDLLARTAADESLTRVDTDFQALLAKAAGARIPAPSTPVPQPDPPEPDLEPEPDVEPDVEREPEPELGPVGAHGGTSTSTSGTGGGAGSGAAGLQDVVGPEHPELDEEAQPERDEPAGTSGEPQIEPVVPTSLQKTDQQDAVQDLTSAVRGGSSAGSASGGTVLPTAKNLGAFAVAGMERTPKVVRLPEPLTLALREQIRRTALRELGVSESAARDFSTALGSTALVIAFLSAHLDHDLDLDPSTMIAVNLFRSADPLLGSVVNKLNALEAGTSAREGLLSRMRAEQKALAAQVAVTEQLMAYLVADQESNFLRGTGDLKSIPVTHEIAVMVRDRARRQVDDLRDLEKRRDGTPMR